MPINVQTPRGVIPFPDGTPPEEIEAFMNAEFPEPDAEPQSDRRLREAIFGREMTRERGEEIVAEGIKTAKGQIPVAMSLAGGALGGIPGGAAGAAAGHLLVGDDLGTAAMSGAANLAIPGALKLVGKSAVPLARKALKPAITAARHRAGIEGVTPNAVANRTAKVVIDEGLKSSDDAAALVSKLEQEIQNAVKSGPSQRAAIDLPDRLPRYMGKLLDRVEKQINRAEVRSGVQKFMSDVAKDSPITRPVPPVGDASLSGKLRAQTGEIRRSITGRPNVDIPRGSGREIRPDIQPKEALDIVRAKSFFDRNASPGAQATGRVVERAVRDGVKQAAPETRALLRRQGTALDAQRALEAMEFRVGNHDPVGLPASVVAAGKTPALGVIVQLLKELQLSGAHAANKVGKAATPTRLLTALLSSHSEADK